MKIKSTSLTSLPQKKITTGLKRLQEAGLTPDQWLKMLDAQPAELQRIVTAWPGVRAPVRSGTGTVYDAAAILGLGEVSSEPLPDAAPGEIVIRVGDWSLQDLRNCEANVQYGFMPDSDWYDEYSFSCKKLTPGVYRVRLPISDSNQKNYNEQRMLLLFGEEVAPVALVAAVLLCHRKQTGKDLLNGDYFRCAEVLLDKQRIEILIYNGNLEVESDADADCYADVWLASSEFLSFAV